MFLEQMYVKSALLHSDLEEKIYVRQSKGFAKNGNTNLVCFLKNLYMDLNNPQDNGISNLKILWLI